jgi:hypothetical protein
MLKISKKIKMGKKAGGMLFSISHEEIFYTAN